MSGKPNVYKEKQAQRQTESDKQCACTRQFNSTPRLNAPLFSLFQTQAHIITQHRMIHVNLKKTKTEIFLHFVHRVLRVAAVRQHRKIQFASGLNHKCLQLS